jgi:hypothetical protein
LYDNQLSYNNGIDYDALFLYVDYFKSKYQLNDRAIRNNIESLIEAGIVSKGNQQKRDIIYESKEVLALLDQFVADISMTSH